MFDTIADRRGTCRIQVFVITGGKVGQVWYKSEASIYSLFRKVSDYSDNLNLV